MFSWHTSVGVLLPQTVIEEIILPLSTQDGMLPSANNVDTVGVEVLVELVDVSAGMNIISSSSCADAITRTRTAPCCSISISLIITSDGGLREFFHLDILLYRF